MYYIHIFLVLIVLYIIKSSGLFNNVQNNKVEGFDGKVGWHCRSCSNKTINQCMQCYNCGFCLDNEGKASCVPGDVHGPYDKKKFCHMWYHSDPYSRVLWYQKWKKKILGIGGKKRP